MTSLRQCVEVVAIATLVGCSGALVACATPQAALQPTRTIHGVLEEPMLITQYSPDVHVGDDCASDDGYGDAVAGSQVILTDARGTTIAFGSLGPATVHEPPGDGWASATCELAFTIDSVRLTGNVYGLHVGNQARGVVDFTAAQLEQPVVLTLGS